jgi:hypothetical protein
MALQTTMKRGAGEMRDRGLQGVQTVVERQQRMFAKIHDDGFLFYQKNGRSGNGGPVRRSAVDSCFFQFATVFGLTPRD